VTAVAPPPASGREASGPRALAPLAPRLVGAAAFRYACYAAMTAVALWAEGRPAPTVPDLLIAWVPYLPWVDRVNYWLWLLVWLPLVTAFLLQAPRRWIRYMVTAGLVSLARGASIALTGLGAPDPAHAGPGVGGRDFWTAYCELLSPLGVFGRDAMAAYLTKDLFFSGHVATTLLLWLYLRARPVLGPVALAAHLLVTASVLVSHIHYGIDVVGAWGITFAIFVLREGWPAPRAAVSP
jgi:hypothetical protein